MEHLKVSSITFVLVNVGLVKVVNTVALLWTDKLWTSSKFQSVFYCLEEAIIVLLTGQFVTQKMCKYLGIQYIIPDVCLFMVIFHFLL